MVLQFGEGPLVSSTKGLAGHAMAACGALESVYTLLMMRAGFVAPTANLEVIAPECGGLGHVQTLIEREINTTIVCNIGLGGFGAALVFRRLQTP